MIINKLLTLHVDGPSVEYLNELQDEWNAQSFADDIYPASLLAAADTSKARPLDKAKADETDANPTSARQLLPDLDAAQLVGV